MFRKERENKVMEKRRLNKSFEQSLKVAVMRYGTKNWIRVGAILNLKPAWCQAYWHQRLAPKLFQKNIELKEMFTQQAKVTEETAEAKNLVLGRDWKSLKGTSAILYTKDKSVANELIDEELKAMAMCSIKTWVLKVLNNLNDNDPEVIVFAQLVKKLQNIVKMCKESNDQREAFVLGNYQKMLTTVAENFLENAVKKYFKECSVVISARGIDKLMNCFFDLHNLERLEFINKRCNNVISINNL